MVRDRSRRRAVGRGVGAEEPLAPGHHVVQRRLAQGERVGDAVAVADRPGAQLAVGLAGQDEAGFGLAEDREEGVERLAQRLVQLDGPAEVAVDLQDGPEDVLGPGDAGDHVERGQVGQGPQDRRAAVAVVDLDGLRGGRSAGCRRS